MALGEGWPIQYLVGGTNCYRRRIPLEDILSNISKGKGNRKGNHGIFCVFDKRSREPGGRKSLAFPSPPS